MFTILFLQNHIKFFIVEQPVLSQRVKLVSITVKLVLHFHRIFETRHVDRIGQE